MDLLVRPPTDPVLARMLAGHPQVRLAGEPAPPGQIAFQQGGWLRKLRFDGGREGVCGLVELEDNNPLVCADAASVPGPLETLALIAFGPLARAGLLVEPPVVQTNAPGDPNPAWLADWGWAHGFQTGQEERDLGTVFAAQCMAVVPQPEDPSEFDTLYEEAFGRSFYVKRDEESDWDTRLVAGRPEAVYRIRLTSDSPHCLLTVLVMADRDGKCGAAQAVHAMNVMAGFEECLGIAESPRT